MGFDPKSKVSKGLGFISMKERVHILGGKMQINSQPQCGTCIEVSVPLRDGMIIADDFENRRDASLKTRRSHSPLQRVSKLSD